MSYNTIVLSGGGIRGFILLGALEFLKKKSFLDNVEHYIATSIGAIISYLLIIGFEPSDIIVQFIQQNYFKKIKSPSFVRILNGEGCFDFEDFNKILIDLTLQKRKTIPTLKELYNDYHKILTIITFNYTKKKEESLSYLTFPDLCILEALRMTSNIPLVFANFSYKEQFYFDGFITNNFPVDYVKEDDVAIGLNLSDASWEEEKNLDFWKIIWNLFFIPLYHLQLIKTSGKNCEIVKLSYNKYSSLKYRLKSKDMLDMFSEGFSNMERFLIKKVCSEKLDEIIEEIILNI